MWSVSSDDKCIYSGCTGGSDTSEDWEHLTSSEKTSSKASRFCMFRRTMNPSLTWTMPVAFILGQVETVARGVQFMFIASSLW